jgi:NAD(P)-dependent dehydrogenase (short-subunit alcohol dehydrogenase family)
VLAVAGDAADPAVTEQAADPAQATGTLAAWSTTPQCSATPGSTPRLPSEVLDLIVANLNLAGVGCATAVRRFLQAGTGGAIVNVSSHQARRAVPGALPYATAKAAVEELTRALALDYGPRGIRVNAVALGSIATERYQAFLAGQEPTAAVRVEEELGRLRRSAGSGVPRRSPRPSPGCSRTVPASSTAPPCPSTAGGRGWPGPRSARPWAVDAAPPPCRPHLAVTIPGPTNADITEDGDAFYSPAMEVRLPY